MKIAMGLLLAAAAAAARAENLTTNINLGGNASEQSAAFGATHIELGSFIDTFNFTPSSGSYLVDASLVTIGFSPGTDVTFTSAAINGHDMTLSGPGIFEFGFLVPTTITGPLALTVNGYVGLPGSVGMPASASYSGTLNISAVPEPQGYAMLLAGLCLAGAAGRWRRRHG